MVSDRKNDCYLVHMLMLAGVQLFEVPIQSEK